ncbi:MAG: hypothetical protein N3G18_10410 [Candidatus Saccharicenans sp.]|nr:hypothetical protein [Candidatus Saccharicenans sp.]
MKKNTVGSLIIWLGVAIVLGFILAVFADMMEGQTLRTGQATVRANIPEKLKLRVPQKIFSFNNKNDLVRFLQNPPAYPDKYLDPYGLGICEADLSTKEVWVAAINDARNPIDGARAGFHSVAIENTSGVPWKAVVKASYELSTVQGALNLWLAINSPSGGGATAFYYRITSPGKYEASTDSLGSFEIKPGHKYYATAFIECIPRAGEVTGGQAKILEIKWTVEF